MSTSIEKAFLKAALCFHPVSSSREYILYANGTCWWFDFGNKPTYRISINSSLRITKRPTLWTLVEKGVVSSCQTEPCSEITITHIPANARAVSRLKFNSWIFMRPDTTHMLLVKTLTPIRKNVKKCPVQSTKKNKPKRDILSPYSSMHTESVILLRSKWPLTVLHEEFVTTCHGSQLVFHKNLNPIHS